MKSPAHQDLSDQALDAIAMQFKVLSDPMRLRFLRALQSGEKSVTELVQATQCLQSNASKHLSILAKAGMVGRRKAGLHTYYFISDPIIFDLCHLMCSKVQKEYQQKAASLLNPPSLKP